MEQEQEASSELPQGLRASTAHFVAWVVLACVNVCTYAALSSTGVPAKVWFARQFFDVGQMLAAGLVVAAVVALGARMGRGPRRWLGRLAVAIGASVVGSRVLVDDLSSRASELAPGAWGQLLLWVMIGLIGTSIPMAAWLPRAIERIWWRGGFAFVALSVAVVNHLLLTRNYPGIHLFAGWLAATALGGALCGNRTAAALGRRLAGRPRWLGPAGGAVLVTVGATAVVMPPPSSVWVELFKASGTIFAPFVARAQAAARERTSVVVAASDWYLDRSELPAIVPSKPSLVPSDAIVVLITIDAMRHELLETDEFEKDLGALLALRNQSVYFTQARAPAPATGPSLAAIFSGRFFSQLYWTKKKRGRGRGKYFLEQERRERFTHLLARNQVTTILFAATSGFMNSYGVCGGFVEESRPHREKRTGRAEKLIDAAIARVERDSSGAMFIYMHLMEPHSPYNLAGKWGTPYQRYVREVGIAGREIQRLDRALTKLGLADRLVLMVGADHGEAFGEHNTKYHALTMYEELLWVPLLIRVPGVQPRRVDRRVSLADLGPTILDLMGAPTPATFLGQSLVPYLRGEDVELERPLVAESGRHIQVMYFADGTKAIFDRRQGVREFYDLEADPGELHNLYDDRIPSVTARFDMLQAFFDRHTLVREGYTVPYRP